MAATLFNILTIILLNNELLTTFYYHILSLKPLRTKTSVLLNF